jgi:hypothetical protein
MVLYQKAALLHLIDQLLVAMVLYQKAALLR